MRSRYFSRRPACAEFLRRTFFCAMSGLAVCLTLTGQECGTAPVPGPPQCKNGTSCPQSFCDPAECDPSACPYSYQSAPGDILCPCPGGSPVSIITCTYMGSCNGCASLPAHDPAHHLWNPSAPALDSEHFLWQHNFGKIARLTEPSKPPIIETHSSEEADSAPHPRSSSQMPSAPPSDLSNGLPDHKVTPQSVRSMSDQSRDTQVRPTGSVKP
jgi:hypothetical protein